MNPLPRLPDFLAVLRANPALGPEPFVDYLVENDATLPDVLRLYAGTWPHTDSVWQEPLAVWLECHGDRERAVAVRGEQEESWQTFWERTGLPRDGKVDVTRPERDRKRRTLSLFPEMRICDLPAALVLILREPLDIYPPHALVEYAATLGYPVPEAVRWVGPGTLDTYHDAIQVISPCACEVLAPWREQAEDVRFQEVVCKLYVYQHPDGKQTRYWLGRCPGRCRSVVWGVEVAAEPRGVINVGRSTVRINGGPPMTIAGREVVMPDDYDTASITPASIDASTLTANLRRRLPRTRRKR